MLTNVTENHETLRISFIGNGVASIDSIISSDAVIAAGSMFVVLILMVVHTRSLFISGLGMLHILLSVSFVYHPFKTIWKKKYN